MAKKIDIVGARPGKLEVVDQPKRRIDPAALGYPLTAFIMVTVTQRRLRAIGDALADVPEVLEVHGLSGVTATDLYDQGNLFVS